MYCDICKSYFEFNDVLFEDGVFKVECKCKCGKKKITSSSNDKTVRKVNK